MLSILNVFKTFFMCFLGFFAVEQEENGMGKAKAINQADADKKQQEVVTVQSRDKIIAKNTNTHNYRLSHCFTSKT